MDARGVLEAAPTGGNAVVPKVVVVEIDDGVVGDDASEKAL